MARAVSWIAWVLAMIAVACLVFLIVGASLDVAVRSVRGEGIPGIIEYGEILLVALAFLSLAHAQDRDGHVSIELLTSRLAPRVATGLEALGLIAVTAVIGWAAWASLPVALTAIETGEFRYGVVQVPVWPARISLPVGFAALFLVLLVRIVTRVRVTLGRAPAEREVVTGEPPAADERYV